MTATPETEVPEAEGALPETLEEDTQPAISDEEINAAIEAEFEKNKARAQAPRRATIQEIFGQSVSLVASATGKRFRDSIPTVSEATGLKLYELALMWALNNRDGSAAPILSDGETDEVAAGEETPLIPAEIIGAAPDEA